MVLKTLLVSENQSNHSIFKLKRVGGTKTYVTLVYRCTDEVDLIFFVALIHNYSCFKFSRIAYSPPSTSRIPIRSVCLWSCALRSNVPLYPLSQLDIIQPDHWLRYQGLSVKETRLDSHISAENRSRIRARNMDIRPPMLTLTPWRASFEIQEPLL